jgi:plastocyanin
MQTLRTLLVSVFAALVLASTGGALATAGTVTLNPTQESQVAAFTLEAGDVVEYTYSSGLATVFRIERGGTEVYNTSSQATHGTFTATAGGQYTFAFRNDGPYLTAVSYDIHPRAGSGQPVDSSSLLLVGGLGAVGATAAVGLGLWARGRKRSGAPPQTPPPPPR